MKSKHFKSTILILPGLGNSGEGHWQTNWERENDFERIEQLDWETPKRTDWVARVQDFVVSRPNSDIILVGHSLACCTIAYWANDFHLKIKGALLVAPSDTESDHYPPGTSGFTPMPLNKLPFPSITITSSNDPYVSLSRARQFADAWGSKLVNIGDAGHINVASGHGDWPQGLTFLDELDR